MTHSQTQETILRKSVWLGILVGWLFQISLATALPSALLFLVRIWSIETENPSLWLEDASDSSHPVWYAMQASVFIGSLLAGIVAAKLSPRKAIIVPIALCVLSLAAKGFEQFPLPATVTLQKLTLLYKMILLIWAGSPSVGVVTGWFVMWNLERNES